MLAAGDASSDAALRRAVSTAYYALFHAIATFTADRLVASGDASGAYSLIYRGLDHRKIKDACEEVAKSTLRLAIRKALKRESVSAELKTFANTFTSMQQLRHLVDYHPSIALSQADVLDLIDETENALDGFASIPRAELTDVVTYMLVGARSS